MASEVEELQSRIKANPDGFNEFELIGLQLWLVVAKNLEGINESLEVIRKRLAA